MVSRFVIAAIVAAPVFIGTNSMAAEKCYEDVYVPAAMTCSDTSSKSADFTNGCKEVAAHYEQKEIECQVGRWVNIIADTRIGNKGAAITQSEACAVYDLKPYNVNGKICASGERPAQQGTGWDAINYKYGTKGGGNGNDGGDKLERTSYSIEVNHGDSTQHFSGTMCYDNKMGAKNNTKQDAAVAVYCK